MLETEDIKKQKVKNKMDRKLNQMSYINAHFHKLDKDLAGLKEKLIGEPIARINLDNDEDNMLEEIADKVPYLDFRNQEKLDYRVSFFT